MMLLEETGVLESLIDMQIMQVEILNKQGNLEGAIRLYKEIEKACRENWFFGKSIVTDDFFKLINMVYSGKIADSVDLLDLSKRNENFILNTKRTPGILYRIENPNITVLIFQTGKVVLSGIRDYESFTTGMNILLEKMNTAGVACYDKPPIILTSFNYSFNLGIKINLEDVLIQIPNHNVWEFLPGMDKSLGPYVSIWQMCDKPILRAGIYSSGKIIISGQGSHIFKTGILIEHDILCMLRNIS